MPTILDDIVTAKRRELQHQEAEVPLEALERHIAAQPIPLNFSGALLGDRVRIIGEVKKASPSRGLLCPDFDPVRLARTYVNNGAAAVSVLTDPRFQGTLEDMAMVKESLHEHGAPVLRKDFIFEPYQVHEARACGADAILLLVAILTPPKVKELLALSHSLRMQCLVEVHTREELEVALDAGAEIIGINNRDLHTFHTDVAVTRDLVGLIPRGKVVVSESGITTREDVLVLRHLGVHAALVGEALVTAHDVGDKVRELTG